MIIDFSNGGARHQRQSHINLFTHNAVGRHTDIREEALLPQVLNGKRYTAVSFGDSDFVAHMQAGITQQYIVVEVVATHNVDAPDDILRR